jgi:hypothetical protein
MAVFAALLVAVVAVLVTGSGG